MEVVLEVSVSVPGSCGASTSITKRCYIIYKPFYGLALMHGECLGNNYNNYSMANSPNEIRTVLLRLGNMEFLLLQMTPQRCYMSKSSHCHHSTGDVSCTLFVTTMYL